MLYKKILTSNNRPNNNLQDDVLRYVTVGAERVTTIGNSIRWTRSARHRAPST